MRWGEDGKETDERDVVLVVLVLEEVRISSESSNELDLSEGGSGLYTTKRMKPKEAQCQLERRERKEAIKGAGKGEGGERRVELRRKGGQERENEPVERTEAGR